MTQTVILKPDNARDRFAYLWRLACEILQFGKNVRVTLDEFKSRRSLEQNAKFHAICGDLAKQMPWAGSRIDTEGWKRLLVDAWARAERKSPGQIVPSLDGQSVVALGIQTRSLPVGDMSDLIEFAIAYAVDHGVRLNDEFRGPISGRVHGHG